jgi:hypothetical protein
MCKANGITGINPLSNAELFDYALHFNTPISAKPKQTLIDFCPELPENIKRRTDKQGFPIPIHKWNALSLMIRASVEKYGETYTGINRRAWGLFMIDRWKSVFNSRLK